MPAFLRTTKYAITLAPFIYLLLLSLRAGVSELDEQAENRIHNWVDPILDKAANDLLASTLSFGQKERVLNATSFSLQSSIGCYGLSRSLKDRSKRKKHFSRPSLHCDNPSKATKNASIQVCQFLEGKRVVFIGPETTYHLHNIWLQSLEKHEGHSMYCPGAQHCVFHRICSRHGAVQALFDGRKQKFPSDRELRESRSAVLQYTMSSALVAVQDKKHAIYTRPFVDPATGVRAHHFYWLRRAQKAGVIVLSRGPIPAPAWTYASVFLSKNQTFDTWVPGSLLSFSLEEKIIDAALNVTINQLLPSLKQTIQAITQDPQIHSKLLIWHGHWPLESGCTNAGLPNMIPLLRQFWSLRSGVVDPWTLFYNVQIYMQDRLLPQILPHFNIIYLPIEMPPPTHPSKSGSGSEDRKDCIRVRPDALEAAFFGGLVRIFELVGYAK